MLLGAVVVAALATATSLAKAAEDEGDGESRLRSFISSFYDGQPVEVTPTADSSTLQYVQLVFRHGDRSPISFLPSDKENGVESWPDGPGELSDRGIQQEYHLGKWLRRRYSSFFPGSKVARNQLYVRSSDYNRTLMSAQALLAGFAPPGSGELLDTDIRWKPFPVHTVPREMDIQLRVFAECPVAEKERVRLQSKTDEALLVLQLKEDLLEQVGNLSGFGTLDLDSVFDVFDNLNAVRFHNSTHHWPSWVDEALFQRISDVYSIGHYFWFNSPLLKRLRSGPLLQEIFARFEQKAAGNMSAAKMYAYSAHDLTIAALLAGLGITPARSPEYAAMVILEMHLIHDKHVIQVYHKNETDSSRLFRYTLQLCHSPCTLSSLKGNLSKNFPSNYQEECGLDQGRSSSHNVLLIVLIVSTLLLVLIILLEVFVRSRRRHVESPRRLSYDIVNTE